MSLYSDLNEVLTPYANKIKEVNGSLSDVDNALGWESIGTADASNDFVYPYHSAQSVRITTEANADISIHGITVNDFTTLINPTYDHIEEIESEVGHTYRITDISDNYNDIAYRVVSRFEGFTVGKRYRICLKITDPHNNVSGGGQYGAVMVGSTIRQTMGNPTTEEQIYTTTFTANNPSLNVYIYPFRGTGGMLHYEHAVGDTFRIDDFYINEINGDVDVLTHEKVFKNSATGIKLTHVVSEGMFVVSSSQDADIDISKAVGRILTINGEAPDATGNMLIKSHIQQKMCVCFGDSITLKGNGFYIDYPYLLGKLTGLNTINCGIGGTSMRYRVNYDTWNMVSFAHMADMVASGNFSDIQTLGNRSGFEMEVVCQRLYPIISAIDWDEVDFITVAYGANDHATSAMDNVNYLENETDKQDVFTYLGAFRYGIDKILSAYPHIKIVVLTPVFRCWTVDGQEVTSDDRVFNDGSHYYDWGNALKKCAEEEIHIPVCDMYNELCINNYNYGWFLGDGIHPTEAGLKNMAYKLAGCIMSKF